MQKLKKTSRIKKLKAQQKELEASLAENLKIQRKLNGGIEETTSVRVKRIRNELGLTQREFADRFGLQIRTIQNWEQSRRVKMDAAGDILMRLIDHDPDWVAKIVGKVRVLDVS